MFQGRLMARGRAASRTAALGGIVTILVLAIPTAANASKGSVHKNGSGGSTSTTTTSPTSTTSTTSTTTSTTTTTAPPPPADTTPPMVSISSPAAGSTIIGTVSVAGAASDNVSVASVQVSVDGAPWQTATGTTSWSWWWSTTGMTNGSHTLSARALDSSGNVSSVASESVDVSNSTSSAPNTQGTWVSPEGVTINVNSTGTDPQTGQLWTIADVYDILKAQTVANSTTQSNFLTVAPHYTIYVQDQYACMTTVSYSQGSNGTYSNYQATTYLQGVGSIFATSPDYVVGHEYGAAWTQYFWVMNHQVSWSSYESTRVDGSTYNGVIYQYLSQDPRLGSSATWTPQEILADDYRLLFGSPSAISERPYPVNSTILDPRNQSGLGDYLLQQWA